jgi:adenylylsulfate kinase
MFLMVSVDSRSVESEPTRRVSSVPGVVITGTIGAGKTSLAEALSELLHENEMRHALIELDWLGQVYPPPRPSDPYSLDLAVDNLGLIASNFHDAGAHYFIVSATLTSTEELRRLRGALPRVHLRVCRVVAPTNVIAERIARRELGSLRSDLLTRTESLGLKIEAAKIDDFVLVNEGPIQQAAIELLGILGWMENGGSVTGRTGPR